MLRLLTPDLDAVEEVDIGEEHFRREVEFYASRLEDVPGEDAGRVAALRSLVESMAAELEEYRKAPAADHLMATVGYIPAAVLTSIKQRLALASRGKPSEAEMHDASLDADRLVVRWGLRGWRGQDQDAMPTETESVHGRERRVASWCAVDAIERTGLLRSLAAVISEFNELSAEKKSRSSVVPGSTETSSTAVTAPESTATLS